MVDINDSKLPQYVVILSEAKMVRAWQYRNAQQIVEMCWRKKSTTYSIRARATTEKVLLQPRADKKRETWKKLRYILYEKSWLNDLKFATKKILDENDIKSTMW